MPRLMGLSSPTWERKFTGYMENGVGRSLTAHVCAVNKCLMSVSKVANAGNRVVFEGDGGYIEDKGTGERIWIVEKRGMYFIKRWVERGDKEGLS